MRQKRNRDRSAQVVATRIARHGVASVRGLAVLRSVPVNVNLLRPDGSYSVPPYVQRGYYEDREFVCKDCGKEELWTATQQKWWYESAKGGVWTTATRCRACRRNERVRKNAARKVHLEGRARKIMAQRQGRVFR